MMLRNAFAVSIVVALLTDQQVSGAKLRAFRGKSSSTVCVSIAVYEEEQYVDALVENFLAFTEPSTKLAIHLDSSTNYTEANPDWEPSRWESRRIAVSSNRIEVKPFQGSILYSHMLNTRTMEAVWPQECAYWVLQASNMMWVREGMEEHVRQAEFSPLGPKTAPSGCFTDRKIENSKVFVEFTDKLVEGKKMYGWGQPEGSFFPMNVVMGFNEMLFNYLQDDHNDEEGIINAKCYFENTWLQTYSLNYANVPGDRFELQHPTSTPLCLNWISYGNKDADSVPMDKVQAVVNGDAGYEGYYAVKRINRHLDHPTTAFIVSESRKHAILRQQPVEDILSTAA